MKDKKNKNPVLQHKFEEGFNEGYKIGRKEGINHATTYLAHRFEHLKSIDGIGPKTLEKIIKVLGREYFELPQSNNQANNNHITTK